MNRLQKKCLIATAGLHLLLVVMVVFGSAFSRRTRSRTNRSCSTVIPANPIDAAFNSGVKNAQPPPRPRRSVTAAAASRQRRHRPPKPRRSRSSRADREAGGKISSRRPDRRSQRRSRQATPELKWTTTARSTHVVRKIHAAQTSEADASEAAKDSKQRAQGDCQQPPRTIKENVTPATTVEHARQQHRGVRELRLRRQKHLRRRRGRRRTTRPTTRRTPRSASPSPATAR